MTRINVDLDPSRLTDQHLLAEYRELPMVPAALRRSLRTNSVGDVLAKIPKKFSLNKGHVSFFYDKMAFLEDRYSKLVSELKRRGVHVNEERTFGGEGLPYMFYRTASFSSEDRKVLISRIKERVSEKPSWYRFNSKPIPNNYFDLIDEGVMHG